MQFHRVSAPPMLEGWLTDLGNCAMNPARCAKNMAADARKAAFDVTCVVKGIVTKGADACSEVAAPQGFTVDVNQADGFADAAPWGSIGIGLGVALLAVLALKK